MNPGGGQAHRQAIGGVAAAVEFGIVQAVAVPEPGTLMNPEGRGGEAASKSAGLSAGSSKFILAAQLSRSAAIEIQRSGPGHPAPPGAALRPWIHNAGADKRQKEKNREEDARVRVFHARLRHQDKSVQVIRRWALGCRRISQRWPSFYAGALMPEVS